MMPNLSQAFCVFILLSNLIHVSEAEIHNYNHNKFTKISILAASGTHSFIRLDDITFVRTKEAASKQKSKMETLVETIVFEIKDKERIGGSDLGSDAICCTSELADVGSCSLGEVIIRRGSSEPEWPKKISTFFEEGKQEVKMSPEAFVINKTGFYTVYFMTCDLSLDGIVVRGRSVWKSLDGYLPGDKAHLVNLYLFMCIAYMVVYLVWPLQVVRYWKDAILFHGHITLVIALSFGELASLFSEFAYLDTTGVTPIKTTLWTITVSSLKKALSRLLLLFISSGYGIVKPTFSGTTLKMLHVGLLCFGLSEALGLATHFGYISENGLTLLMLSWTILETIFFLWIFMSLWQTLTKLKVNKKNIGKLQLYKRFARVLVIMVVLSFVCVCVEVYVNNSLSDFWRVNWIIPTCWHLLSYALLVFICLNWGPTEKPTRYLYIAEMEDEFIEEELPVTGLGMKTEDHCGYTGIYKERGM